MVGGWVAVCEWLEMGRQVGGEVDRGGKIGLLIDWSVERGVSGCMAGRLAGWLKGWTAKSAFYAYMYGYMDVAFAPW